MKGFQNHTSRSRTSDVLQRRDLKQRDSLPWDIDIAARERDSVGGLGRRRGGRGGGVLLRHYTDLSSKEWCLD